MFAISWLRATRAGAPVSAFIIALIVYGAAAGNRLGTQSSDPHFVAQAWAWLHGRLDLERWPAGADDPAIVDHVLLDDGTEVRGRRLLTRDVFRVAGGREIPAARVRAVTGAEYQVAFPPFPAAVFLPMVLVFGPGADDVAATVILGALAPALCLIVLRRLRERGLSSRTPADDVWFAALLAFGTVLFFSAVQGRIWYTAHVVAVDLCLLYVWASVDAEHPLLAGACLGLAFLTRAPMLFMFPLFVAEMWRAGRDREWRVWTVFAVPVVCAGIVAAWDNHARFGEVLEFGHSYLRARQALDIERYGLFSSHYVVRNVVAAFGLLPELSMRPPYIAISGHGLAVWFTTPALVLLLRARPRHAFQFGLWLSVASVAIWTLAYQNTGWFQFGFRFALDYIVFLVVLLAVDQQPCARLTRALIAVSVVVNLFGAVTFGRYPEFYRADLAAYEALVHD